MAVFLHEVSVNEENEAVWHSGKNAGLGGRKEQEKLESELQASLPSPPAVTTYVIIGKSP